jgi:hypothetical protein
MIDSSKEDLKLLVHAAELVPGRPHVSTLVRWAMRGVRGRRLETVVIGGRRFTSVEAIRRFIDSSDRRSQSQVADFSIPNARQAEVDARLNSLGF